MKQLQLLSLAVLGVVSAGALSGDAWAQALPPGQEEEGTVVKKPPFSGLGLDINAWNQMGLWAGEGTESFRNDFGFLLIPSWAIGRSLIGRGPFRSLSLSARFFFNVPVSGFDDTNQTGNAPPWSEQQPCALGQSTSLIYANLPRCPWGRGARRVDYSDLSLILASPRVYTIPTIGVHIDPTFIVTLPTSAQSRLATMAMQLTGQVGLGREFWKNRIGIAYTFGYGMPFHRYTTGDVSYDSSGADVAYNQDVLARGLSNFYTDSSGVGLLCLAGEKCRNPTLFVQHTIRGTLNIIDPLSLTVIYRITNTQVRNPGPGDCATVPYAQRTLCGDGRVLWLDSQLLWFALNYQPLPWLGVSLSWITGAPFWEFDKTRQGETLPDPDGRYPSTRHYRQAFISADANAFTSVSLGVDVTLETLASKFWK